MFANVGTTLCRLTIAELKITVPRKEIVLVPTSALSSSQIAQTSYSTPRKQFLYQQDLDLDLGRFHC